MTETLNTQKQSRLPIRVFFTIPAWRRSYEDFTMKIKKRKGFISANALLRWAAKNGNAELAQIAINKGVNVHTKDRWGRVPLHLCAANGHIEVVSLLVANNATIDIPDDTGLLPIALALDCGHMPIVKCLLYAKESQKQEKIADCIKFLTELSQD